MDKKEQIIELIDKLSKIPEKKKIAVMNQTYEIAAKIRDEISKRS